MSKTMNSPHHDKSSEYNPHALRVLEFDQVREIIAAFADSAEGRNILSELKPSTSSKTAREKLSEADELMRALRFDDQPPGIAIPNIRALFPRLRVEGIHLDIEDIAAVADVLECGSDIADYFTAKKEKYPITARFVADINPQGALVRDIRRIITPDLTIADNATPELRSIRRSLSRMRSDLRNIVERTLSSLPEDVISERTVTIRDGRHVIPVRDSMRKRVPGAVHDRSQTGKTLFIEPIAVIEGNNRVRELELEEQAEVLRILGVLTARIADAADDIIHLLEILVRIDTIMARARFGVALDCNIPVITDEPFVKIIKGRHPLLEWKFRKRNDGSKVVPLDIEIGRPIRTVVITGPNAGGKTVALKTLGLITLLGLAGIPVPAGADTSLYAPPDIFADIGDEQSIEDDLSTFSSHMKHIVTLLRNAGPDTMVLMDELGGGTNPADGEAIALAVLKKLTDTGAVTLATSHHDRIKVYAHETESVMNASMEFDNRSHRPTFLLRTGVPGSSYAFEIAERMGMPDDVLETAKSLVGDDKTSLAGLITEMEETLKAIRKDRDTARTERTLMESAKRKYEEKYANINVKRQELLAEALAESGKILDDTNRQVELIIKSLRETKASHEAIVKAKSDIKQAAAKIKKRTAKLPKKESDVSPVETLTKGMLVRLEHLGADAVVEEVLADGNKARIRVGKSNATLVVEKSKLTRSRRKPQKSEQKIVVKTPASPDVTQEIDLRGMTFDEARDALDMFLDDILRAGLETARIIHGKGTGALRKKISGHLDHHRNVSSHRLGEWNEGSFGVTIVTMKK